MTLKEKVAIIEASKESLVVLTCFKGEFSCIKVEDLEEVKALKKQIRNLKRRNKKYSKLLTFKLKEEL